MYIKKNAKNQVIINKTNLKCFTQKMGICSGWGTALQTRRSRVPDGVTGIFQWLNPSDRIVALGSTQRRTEMSTRNPFWE
jgi:hypothetical protein